MTLGALALWVFGFFFLTLGAWKCSIAPPREVVPPLPDYAPRESIFSSPIARYVPAASLTRVLTPPFSTRRYFPSLPVFSQTAWRFRPLGVAVPELPGLTPK